MSPKRQAALTRYANFVANVTGLNPVGFVLMANGLKCDVSGIVLYSEREGLKGLHIRFPVPDEIARIQ